MKYLLNPESKQNLFERNYQDLSEMEIKIKSVFDKVSSESDSALFQYTAQFDGVRLQSLEVSQQDLNIAETLVSEELKFAIQTAYTNIFQYHTAQKQEDIQLTTAQGIELARKSVAIPNIGLYVPGGTAPLFSTVLMLAVPAQIAKPDQVVLCTPPQKDGSIHPAILYAAKLCGVKTVFKLGGAQAIAAMSLGTETVPKVDKLFGPGNSFVTAAKQYAQNLGLAIDMPAGPSELLVIADNSATPAFVAADYLSQVEHGVDSQSVLICTNEELAKKCMSEIEQQTQQLSRKDIILKALENSYVVVVSDLKRALELSNQYAPEHLILNCDYAQIIDKVQNAGSVFLGNYTPESLGDYASGTNHTLPTNAYARAYSGLSLASYMKTISFQNADKVAFEKIAQTVSCMAENELLDAHQRAVTIRLEKK